MKDNHNIKTQLTNLFQLDKEYFKGTADWLWYKDENGRQQRVLDLVGAYGINLLGHNHPELTTFACANLNKSAPNFTHISKHAATEELEESFRILLNRERQSVNWSFLHSNTGSEAIEAALKTAYLYYLNRKEIGIQKLHQCKLKLQHHYPELAPLFKKTLHISSYEEAVRYYDHCLQKLQEDGKILAVKNAYHGKTAGAVSALDNPYFHQHFPSAYTTTWVDENSSSDEIFLKNTYKIKLLHKKQNRFIDYDFCNYFAFLFEPIQGEGGIKTLNATWLQQLSNQCRRKNVPIIADEIQSGLYRTGSLAMSHQLGVEADIYCFGKALGAGIAKIAITAIDPSILNRKIFLLHSSSFAEDNLSMKIAKKTLDILSLEFSIDQCLLLKSELLELQAQFPQVIWNVSGQGNMLGIQFNKEKINDNYFTKFLDDLNMIGYWIAAIFLAQEKIRILPSLSAPYTFRIEPSIYFSAEQRNLTRQAFQRFCEAISQNNKTYLYNNFLPSPQSTISFNKLTKVLKKLDIKPGAAFFICHPIDLLHVKKILKLENVFQEDHLEKIIEAVTDLQNFTPYHKTTIKNRKGEERDVVFLGIPLTSKSFLTALRKGRQAKMVAKIQAAIDLAESFDAKIIGLGQFTSIISENGSLVHTQKAKLVTGNTYTVALSLQALKQACQLQQKRMEDLEIALVGASGNILSVMAEYLAGKVKRMNLVHRPSSLNAKRQIRKTANLVQKISFHQIPVFYDAIGEANLSLNKITQLIQEDKWNDKFGSFLQLTDHISSIQNADIIILGTNSVETLVTTKLIKKQAIVIDIAVPANADKEVQQRKDIIYLKGGMAKLPVFQNQAQSLNSVIFPFEGSLCYGCMAETIGLSFSSKSSLQNINTIDDLSPEAIKTVAGILEDQGFRLGGFKFADSF